MESEESKKLIWELVTKHTVKDVHHLVKFTASGILGEDKEGLNGVETFTVSG